MDSLEPEQTPFAAVSAQTSKFSRVSGKLKTNCFQLLLDNYEGGDD